VLRVLSISTLFPSPARPAFGRFVANQMQAVAATGEVALTMVNPLGLPPWPLSRSSRYRPLAAAPGQSACGNLTVLHPRFRLMPRIGGDDNPARIAAALLPQARRLHAERRFDLVDAQFFFPDGPAAAIIARELRLPLSIKARGSDIYLWGLRAKARAQMLHAARKAAGLLAVSQALARDMAALGMPGERIAVHYTGLDRARFRPMARAAARAAIAAEPGLTIPGDGPLLVTPGALIAIKGQRLAIAALADLPGARLALAGAGEDEAALRRLAHDLGLADRVHLLGQVSHEHLPRLLSAADAVVLPSEREGLANAWIEALACGAPLVIPDIGGAREVLRDDTAGRIAPRDPVAIAAAVRSLLAAPPAQNAVAATVARFSWENNARELIACWRGFVQGPRGSR
jgi:glycosyltransferase involved in cell wall biosynthesis